MASVVPSYTLPAAVIPATLRLAGLMPAVVVVAVSSCRRPGPVRVSPVMVTVSPAHVLRREGTDGSVGVERDLVIGVDGAGERASVSSVASVVPS